MRQEVDHLIQKFNRISVLVLIAACGMTGCASQPSAGPAQEPPVGRTVLLKFGTVRPVREETPSKPSAATNTGIPSRMPMTLPVRSADMPAAASSQPATAPAPGSDEAKAQSAFNIVAQQLGRTGTYKTPAVYVVSVPRDDLTILIEGMEVPTAAGVESVFNFYYCPCGKTSVVGQFCVLDYESNDVIDALRAARIEIVSVAPMLMHARQAPLLIRFHAEGQPEPIAKAIREGLRWTGKERLPVTPMLPR